MTPLRQKMINDMKLRRFFTSTQQAYLDVMAGLAKFFNQPPDRLYYVCLETAIFQQ